jgi:hypothetical protein
MYRSTFSWPRHYLEVSSQLHAKAHCTHWIGDWVVLGAGLHDMKKGKFCILPGLKVRQFGHPTRRHTDYTDRATEALSGNGALLRCGRMPGYVSASGTKANGDTCFSRVDVKHAIAITWRCRQQTDSYSAHGDLTHVRALLFSIPVHSFGCSRTLSTRHTYTWTGVCRGNVSGLQSWGAYLSNYTASHTRGQ